MRAREACRQRTAGKLASQQAEAEWQEPEGQPEDELDNAQEEGGQESRLESSLEQISTLAAPAVDESMMGSFMEVLPPEPEPAPPLWNEQSVVLTPQSRPMSPAAPIRAQTLHELHASKQKKLEGKRLALDEQERRLRQERYEASMKKSRRNWPSEPLDPQAAVERLYADHRARSLDLAKKRQKLEEEEQRELEERRFRRNPRSESVPSQARARDAVERLHREHERRRQDVQRRKEAMEAKIQEELEKSSSGPYKRCLSARGDTKRHEELYNYAAIQREVLNRKRQERREAEERKYNAAMVTVRSGPHDPKHLEGLHRDHQEKEQRRAFKKAEQQSWEQQKIEDAKKSRWKPPSSPRSLGLDQVLVTLHLVDVDYGMLVADPALLEEFHAVVAQAVADEAGEEVGPEVVEVEFQEREHLLTVLATISFQNGTAAASVHASLSAAESLGTAIAAALSALEDAGAVCQGDIGVSEMGVSVELVQPERQRALPIWQRIAQPNRTDEPQEHNRVAVGSPATPCDLVLNAVVSSINSQCYGDRTSTVAELKWLAAPLQAAMAALKLAADASDKGEGYLKLASLPGQRIFLDGQLMPEDEGWRACIEPSPIRQVEEDLDSLLETAAAAQELLGELLAPGHFEDWEPGTSKTRPSGVPSAALAHNPGVKSRERAELKAFVRYQASDQGRACRHLLDLARFGLLFADSRMLQRGLETIIEKFEVLSVQNFYQQPGRLGQRMVEVLLCLEVDCPRGGSVPHVCELRLEELVFENIRPQVMPALEQFYERIASVYQNQTRDAAAVAYLAHAVLADAPESHGLRSFRRRLGKAFGSTVTGWRRHFSGSSRPVTFGRFRDLCHGLGVRREAPDHWSRLDPGKSGCISLFEVDPDAVALLVHLRSRILTISSGDDMDSEDLFRRLTYHICLNKPGQLDIAEFRAVLKGFGFDIPVADRAFTLLDLDGGDCKPPASVSAADIAWLQHLPKLIDVDAVMLNCKSKLNDLESLRHLVSYKGQTAGLDTCLHTWEAARGRRTGHCRSVPAPARGRSREESFSKPADTSKRRSSSREPVRQQRLSDVNESLISTVASSPEPRSSVQQRTSDAGESLSVRQELLADGVDVPGARASVLDGATE